MPVSYAPAPGLDGPLVCVAGPVCLFRAAKKGGVSARTRVSEVGPLVWPFRGAEGGCVALQYWGREVKGLVSS